MMTANPIRSTATAVRSRQHAMTPRIRLGTGARKAVLVVHILSVGAWIGTDILVGVMVVVGWFADDTGLRVTAYRALASFVLWPMLIAGVLCLLSGIVLGLASKWGLLRFGWVAVKLAINTILVILIVIALQPVMADVAAYGDALAAGRETSSEEISSLFYPPAVSLTALGFATVLAVFKPWGRVRRRRDTRPTPPVTSAGRPDTLPKRAQR